MGTKFTKRNKRNDMKDKIDDYDEAAAYHREFVKRQTGVYLDTNKGDGFANTNLTVEDFNTLTRSKMKDKKRPLSNDLILVISSLYDDIRHHQKKEVQNPECIEMIKHLQIQYNELKE